ncbi:MAG: hypothetical protein CMC55_06880 [Flavobacteriaceae bacterium]|uniref:serine hydrolase n=1 Tax=Bizionia echini TaxID=649333 RepID=UPI000C899584|nr:hypothetical protein [Flavobacteriaceae bacterium]
MISKKLIFIFLFFALFFSISNAQSNHFVKSSLSTLAEAFHDSLSFNGSLLVAKDNMILLNKSYGYSNFEHGTKNSNQTPFRIASVSKMFTSYAVYILASQKRLSLDDPITKYIPSLDSKFKNISISQLLKHKSGLVRSIDNYLESAPHLTYNKNEIIEAINNTDLNLEVNNKLHYSNVGYILLGLVIEKVTNETYGNAMKDLIFTPLGLNQTFHEIEGVIILNRASGYNMLEGEIFKSSHENKSHVLAAGSLMSSTTDLFLFSKELIRGSLLNKELHKHYLTLDENFRTNSGLVTWNYTSKLASEKATGQVVMHSGLSPGFSSSVAIFLDHNLIVIGLSNQNPIDMSLVYNKLGNVALGFEEETVGTPTLNKLVDYIVMGNFDEAIKRYDNILKKDPNLKIKPKELNGLGYSYLQYLINEKAINVFTFFTMIYPENANAFDSLGEAYLTNNNIEKAIKYYKKSIELNPNNIVAKKIVNEYN